MKALEKAAYGAGYGLGSAGRMAGRLAFGGVALGATALTATLGFLTGGVLSTGAKFEQFQASLEGTEGSAAKAKNSMAWVTRFAADTPYEIDQVMDSFVRLKNFGIDPVHGVLESLGNAASGINRPLIDAVDMLTDASTGEYERLKAFGIRASVQGNKVSLTYQKAGKDITRTADKTGGAVQRVLMEIFGDRFPQMMKRQSQTLNGMLSNLRDSFTTFQVSIANAGFFDAVKSKISSVLATANKLAADGTLKRWAGEISERLTVMVNKAWDFANKTDWKMVSENLSAVGSAMWAIVRATAEAVRMVQSLDGFLRSLPQPPAWIGKVNNAAASFMTTPFADWGKSAPNATPSAPRRQRVPTMSQGQLDGAWRRSLQLGPPAGPVRQQRSGPMAIPKPGRVEVDVRLSGPGAKDASVRRVSTSGPVVATANRGAAMAGAA